MSIILASVCAGLCLQVSALAAPVTQEAPASGSPAVTATLHPAVELAKTLIGIPYRWAGADPVAGFDCSGLVYYVFNQLQVRMPRVPRDLFSRTEQIGRSELQPGDLLFFHTFARLSHVGIYIGEGRFIHAPRRGQNVRIESIDSKYYQKRYAGARRVMSTPISPALTPDPGV
jgi:cell wall-associated NlpC family hydrolase